MKQSSVKDIDLVRTVIHKHGLLFLRYNETMWKRILLLIFFLVGCTYSQDAKPIYLKDYVQVEYQANQIEDIKLKKNIKKKFDQTNEVEMQFVKSIHLTTKTKQVKEGQHITIHVSYDPELYEQINYHLYPENNKTMDYVVHFR